MSHTCEPTYYPTSLLESWDCPECGAEYTASDPHDWDAPPWASIAFLPDALGWLCTSRPG